MKVVYQFHQAEINELVTLLREAVRWGRHLAKNVPAQAQAEPGYLRRVAQIETIIDKIQSRS